MNLGTNNKMYPLRNADAYFIGKPEGVQSQQYLDISTNTVDLPWTGCIIAIGGATASTAVGYIELIINYEWLPVNSSGYATAATAAAPSVPKIMDARSNLFSKVETVGKYTASHDGAWVREAGKFVLRTLGGYAFGGPGGAVAGLLTNAMDVD
jgi:hypothetical protein